MSMLLGTRRALLGKRGIRWLLRDEFTDTRAAGSVNGTAATPGPGTRTVTDTGNNLSVTGGSLAFAGGAGAWGDPGLWYEAFARISGRVLIHRGVRITAPAAPDLIVGFDDNQAGVAQRQSVYFVGASGAIGVYDAGGASNVAVGTYALATTYHIAVVLRAAGGYYFIQGGAFTNWTLLWVGGSWAGTPTYPVSESFDAVGTIDAIRIPDELWLPTPLAYDTFTRANGALGNSETTGPDSQDTPARAWNNRVGTTQVQGNVAQATALDGGVAIATVDTGTANVLHGANLTRAGNEVGIVVRYTDSNNYVRAYHDGANVKLDKVVAAAVTNVISAATVYAAGATMWIICQGTSFSLYYNNAQVGATSTIADAALQAGTEQGLYTTNVGNTQDVVRVFPRGTGGEYTRLDRYSG